MTKLTKNFSLKEFECKDGSTIPDDLLDNVQELSEQLQILRDFIGKPININSSYRSPSHNKRVGGKSKSQHLLAKAADIKVEGVRASDIHGIISELIKDGRMKEGGLGKYASFTHYDIGFDGRKRRW